MKLSIESSVYKAELVLDGLVEIILVANFSSDNSWQKKASLSSVWFLSRCVLTRLGIVGLYICKTFEGGKNRPTYIIEKTTDE